MHRAVGITNVQINQLGPDEYNEANDVFGDNFNYGERQKQAEPKDLRMALRQCGLELIRPNPLGCIIPFGWIDGIWIKHDILNGKGNWSSGLVTIKGSWFRLYAILVASSSIPLFMLFLVSRGVDYTLLAISIVCLVVSYCLLLCTKIYKVKFIYTTRTCEVSYYRNCIPCCYSRQISVSFDDIAYAKAYPKRWKLCALEETSFYISLVLKNKTSIRITGLNQSSSGITEYGLDGPMVLTDEEIVLRDSGRYVQTFNKFIKTVLHKKEFQIDPNEKIVKKREDSITEMF